MEWTKEKLDELKSLLGTMTVGDMAIHLGGIDPASIRWQIRKHGWSNPVPWERPWIEVRAVSMAAARNGIREAARQFGLTIQVVKNITKRYRDSRLSYVRDLTPKNIETKRKAAIHYAHRKGYQDYAEDFGSFAVIQMLSTGNCNFAFLFPNFVKKTFGDYRSKSGRKEYNTSRFGVDINDTAVIQLPAHEPFNAEKEFQEIYLSSKIPSSLRVLFLLSYMWELEIQEITFLLDIDEGQVLKDIKKIELCIIENIRNVE